MRCPQQTIFQGYPLYLLELRTLADSRFGRSVSRPGCSCGVVSGIGCLCLFLWIIGLSTGYPSDPITSPADNERIFPSIRIIHVRTFSTFSRYPNYYDNLDTVNNSVSTAFRLPSRNSDNAENSPKGNCIVLSAVGVVINGLVSDSVSIFKSGHSYCKTS